MESIETPLDVLSRAATMVQHCRTYPREPASDDSFGLTIELGTHLDLTSFVAGVNNQESVSTGSGESESERSGVGAGAEARGSSKQLPTAKWRRERRSCRLPDYKPREGGTGKALRSQSFNEKRLTSKVSRDQHSDGEASDGSGDGTGGSMEPARHRRADPDPTLNGRGAPPEYPGAGSVEAPIDMRLRSRPSPPPYPCTPPLPPPPRPSVIRAADPPLPPTGSVSMCDPVIDEHFRRSLGDDYMTLFAKKAQETAQPGPKPNTKDRGSSPITFPSEPTDPALKVETSRKIIETVSMDVDDPSVSVDDHFAKALGETWKKIQSSVTAESKDSAKPKVGSKIISRSGVVI